MSVIVAFLLFAFVLGLGLLAGFVPGLQGVFGKYLPANGGRVTVRDMYRAAGCWFD